MDALSLAPTGPTLSLTNWNRGWFWAFAAAQGIATLAAALAGVWIMLLPTLAILSCLVLVSPRVGLVVLIPSLFLKLPLVPGTGIYPADFVVLGILVGYGSRALINGRSLFGERSPLDRFYRFFLLVLILSLVGAPMIWPGIINWFRHLQLMLLFSVAYSILDRALTFIIIVLTAAMGMLVSVPNIYGYFVSGGQLRFFGLAGGFMYIPLALSAVQMAVFAMMASTVPRRILSIVAFAFVLLGIIATQSRQPLLQLAVVLPLVGHRAWRYATRTGDLKLKSRLIKLVCVIAVIVVICAAILAPYFGNLVQRVEDVLDLTDTSTLIRLYLARTSLEAFLDHPLLGIGLVQVEYWELALPQLKYEAAAFYNRRLGTHNDVLTYLAEGGILGLVAFLALMFAAYFMGRKLEQSSVSMISDKTLHIALFGSTAIMVLRGLLDTHSFWSIAGIFTALTFAMTAREFVNCRGRQGQHGVRDTL